MSNLTLATGVLLDLTAAVMLTYVGLRLRKLADPDVGLRVSQWFWYGAATFMVLDGGFAVIIVAVEPPLWLATAVLILRRFVFTLAFLTFGAWLKTLNGDHDLRVWWTFAALLAGAVFIQTWLQGVSGYLERPWSVALVAARPTPVWVNVLFGIALFAPPGWQALRLLRLMPSLSAVQRYRSAAIAGSTLLFCALIIAGFVNNQWFWYGFFENRSVFSIATGVLIAMRPPYILRKRGFTRMVSALEFPGRHHANNP